MSIQSPQAQFVERSNCINCGSAKLSELSSGRYTDEPLHGFLAADPWGENPLPFLQAATWSLVKCDDCSQVFHRRILNEEWNERRFSKWMSADAILAFEAALGPSARRSWQAATEHTEHVLRIEKLTRPIRAELEPVRLLDFGCGFGSFLECAAHFGFEAVGVDRAAPRRQSANLKILPDLAEAHALKFHAITLFEVLEHLDNPSGILSDLAKLLLPGGVLVLETPDCSGVTDIKSKADYLAAHPLEHLNCFTNETLSSIATRRGFSLISKGAAHVTTEPIKAIKNEVKSAIGKDAKSTQLYFTAG